MAAVLEEAGTHQSGVRPPGAFGAHPAVDRRVTPGVEEQC